MFYVLEENELPSDLVFTGIVAESPLGLDFSPVMITSASGEIPPDISSLSFWPQGELITEPLPASRESTRFNIGALVGVPADGDETPEQAALLLRGIEYTVDGANYVQAVNNNAWISRTDVNSPDFCPGYNERADAVNAEAGFE